MRSVCGAHLGHNIPDGRDRRPWASIPPAAVGLGIAPWGGARGWSWPGVRGGPALVPVRRRRA
eukprot:9479599-Pyramimonas_sp.AAC.1